MISIQSRKYFARVDGNPDNKGKACKPKELKWNDFCGKVDKDSKFSAHSYWKIKFTYEPFEINGQVCVSVYVDCVFDKRSSWAKHENKSNELLKHEQFHYNIGCLCALEFKKRALESLFSLNKYNKEINDLFSKTLNEFLEYEIKYDEETDHFKNKQMQKKWEGEIESKLAELKNYW